VASPHLNVIIGKLITIKFIFKFTFTLLVQYWSGGTHAIGGCLISASDCGRRLYRIKNRVRWDARVRYVRMNENETIGVCLMDGRPVCGLTNGMYRAETDRWACYLYNDARGILLSVQERH
jgi:hypothetical protein